LERIVTNSGYNIDVLDSNQLNTDVNENHLSELTEFEKDEVKLWLPANIGKLMFSDCFD
jgi:hypothetical protein